MAKATTKAASLTTLVIGQVEVAVGLFSTVAKPGGLTEFATAGPNGGKLKAQVIARPTPVLSDAIDEGADVPVHSSDPLAGESEVGESPLTGVGYGTAAMDAITDKPAMTFDGEKHHDIDMGGSSELRERVKREVLEADREAVDGQYGRELVEEGSGVVVLPQDVRRGVRLEDGRFIDCTEQLAEIDKQTKLERMEVIRFVDISAVPRVRVKGAYYLGAGDETAPKPLRLLYEGMKFTRRGALVKLTKKSRQSLGVIGWLGDSLMLYELVWAEDFRAAPARATRIQKVAVTQTEVSMVCELISAMSGGPGVIDELRDDAIGLREELMGKALAGEVPQVLEPMAAPEEAQDLMAQLEASLAAVSS